MTKIAVGSIFTECNHLGGDPTDLACFERYELRRGNEGVTQKTGTVGGMLSVLGERQVHVVPLIFASACPGGPLTAECYRQLKRELLERLQVAGSIDGVLLALHGAASAADVGDLEGDLLQSVRAIVGPELPVVATLDLHAHVTGQMVHAVDALIAMETYPHKDAFSTGERGAVMLLDILACKCRPTMALAKVPVLVGGVRGNTEGEGPFADVMRFAKNYEREGHVLSASVFLVHPYLDLPEMGGGGLVITDNDMPRAVTVAVEIARRYWERRFDLDPPSFSPMAAILRGLEIEGGPVLLVETADCCGGGAAGDSVLTLQALLTLASHATALVPVVDPEAAASCHQSGVGCEVSLKLGHKLDPRWGEPLSLTGQVAKLSDGQFCYTGGIWEGQTGYMGSSAVLKIGGIQVLITSHSTYDWADEQFRALGLDPFAVKFVVVKNPMNHRLAYAGKYREAILLDTPGPTPAGLHHVKYRHLARPYYPADRDIPSMEPSVWTRAR